MTRLSGADTDATVSGRLWLYSNYHCKLACAYCLTESAPKVGSPDSSVGRSSGFCGSVAAEGEHGEGDEGFG